MERLVVGLQPVREALRAHGERVGPVMIEDSRTARLEALARFASDQGVARVERVERRELDRLAGGVSHQGAAAWAPPLRLLSPDELLARPALAAVALDGIQDPQNFGAVVRAAVAMSGAAVVWGEHGAAPLSLSTFRASAGAIEHAELCRVRSLTNLLRDAASQGVQIVGLDPQAPKRLSELDLSGATIVVVGAEHEGLKRAVRRSCTAFAALAPRSAVESLNASVAAGIALYEIQYQRLKSSG